MNTITIPKHYPQSWNKAWAGQHWTKRKKYADTVHMLVRANVSPDAVPKTPLTRCKVLIRAYYPNLRVRHDAGNVCNKPYIDALIGLFYEDDSPDIVYSVTTESYLDRENPRTEIVVSEEK